MYGQKGYGGFGGWGGGKGWGPPMFYGYDGWGMKGFPFKGKGKGKRSPQLNVDPTRKIWIGNLPEAAKWKDLQELVDSHGKSKWVEIFSGKGKGTAAVVFATAEEASEAISKLNGSDLCGSSIVVDAWEKGSKS
eukprot:TRINITY_DN23051_c0_g1_i1.p1 TRINITY_DN23051_c0_g1~~TRINITY_DN23051_c0_g1_i1.p1  ORF type:complete len:153 (+),score=49.01 TRINITY_DN23051_c0_g1_i1:58-459(+)